MENNCEGCIWHDDFTWACCNGDSEHRADFVNCGCEYKEVRKKLGKTAQENWALQSVTNGKRRGAVKCLCWLHGTEFNARCLFTGGEKSAVRLRAVRAD